MSQKSDGIDWRLWFALHRTHDLLSHEEEKVFNDEGLTPEQYGVLLAVKNLYNPVRVTDVANTLLRSTNSISMIVDRMVKAELLHRKRDLKDRRPVRLILTRKAEALFWLAQAAADEFLRDVLSRMSERHKQVLFELLTELGNAVVTRSSAK